MIIALQALYLFQKSLLAVFEQILEPYLKSIFFYKNSTDVNLEADSDDDVYSEFDDNKGVVFYPPVYTQRYAAVSDCLLDTRWRGQLEKVIDFGCNDMSFIKCLKDIPGIRDIMGVDLDPIPITLDIKSDGYSQKRENPLKITLYQGNAADPDYRLIGCDAVVSIEMIEHMLPHDLERFVHNIFGFTKPWVVVVTTPNGDFNVLFKALETNGLRRLDHMFEWSREQFHDWCSNIVTRYPEYSVSCKGIGPGPPGTSHLGCCSQLALFVASNYKKQTELSPNSIAFVECDSGSALTDSMNSWDMTESVLENRLHCTNNQVKTFSKTTHQLMAKNKLDTRVNAKDAVDEIRHLSKIANPDSQESIWKNINWGEDAPYWNKYYKIIKEYSYPFAAKSDETRILEEISEEINRLICRSGEEFFLQDDKMDIPIGYIMGLVSHITDDEDKVRELLEWNGYEVVGDTVVYTKLIEGDLPVDVQKEWIEVDSVSDWVSTDSQSLAMLENITEPDMFEYDLQLSLDHKIRSLLKLSKRMDISSELERLVFRLVELVQDSRRSEFPPHPTWSLHKLHGLLALTEEAMMKQRRNFIGDCKKAIKFSKRYKGDQNVTIISIGIEKARKAENILERYGSSFLGLDNDKSIEHLKFDNSNELLTHFKMTNGNMSSDDTDRENKALLQSYDSLIEELELREVNYKELKKADTTTSVSAGNVHVLQIDKMAKTSSCSRATEYLQSNNNDDEEVVVIKAEPMRKRQRKFIGHKNKLKHKKYKKTRKFTSFASGYINYFKNETIQYHQQKVKLHKKTTYYSPKCKSIKPIPSSLMNLFNSSQNKIEVSQKSSIGYIEFSEPESLVTVKHQEDATVNRTIDTVPNILDQSEKKDVESKVAKSVSCHTETNIQEVFGHTSVLFMYDINEPSTSNGIRHISADIQCGPDDVMDVSQTRLANYTLNITSKRYNTDLNIQASTSDFQNTIGTNTSNSAFDNYESIITKGHVVEDLKVEESKKYELQEETKSLTKSVFKNLETIVKPHETKVNSKRSYLSYGGIYVHCYKNRNSEDIVYQGKWQECNSKNIAKKTPIVLYGRRKEMIVKKKIITEKDLLNTPGPAANNREYKRKISYRNSVRSNVAHRKPENNSCLDPGNAKKKNRHVRLVKPSVDIRPLETSTAVTKFFDTSHIFDIKNYIPAYLKRRIHKYSMDKKLNLNLNIVLNTYNKGEQLQNLQLKSAGNTQTARYKPNSYHRKIPAYQVYRNEIDKEMIDLRGAEDEKLKKCIPASTSSYDPCSSRSSNVTYRNITNNGVGYSSERSSSDNYEPGDYKNTIRRVRMLKSIKNVKTYVTKFENIEQSTHPPCRLENIKSPGLSSGVELTETSFDLSFSNDKLLKCKKVTNSASTIYSAHNTQTSESPFKLAFVEAEKSNENVETDTDDNIEKQIRSLINESLGNFERFCTVDKKGGVHNLDQVADDKESVRSDYTSTLTLPSTSSAAKTELFTGVQEENGSKVSIEYSNIDSGVQDVELLSPMSVASVTTSKFSEYLSADNEDSSSLNSNSIFSFPQDSCDHKENMSNPPEISQRSSQDTYMSCSTDEDTQIPYWLFESDSEPERLVTSPLEEETEDSEDETENDPSELAVVGIGAGDGRGIHSDLSRDTSGRGTSLNSGTSSLESQETLSNPSS